ncbi:MAG: DUF2752 domain-containing protein [Planctomycetes bacterium]|nr:DUF2752 domain-containing protein [Planctomycetota bacterium]
MTSTCEKPRRARLTERGLAGLFLIGVAAAGVLTALRGVPPADVHLVPCPFDAVLGVRCPGCGMTRACVAITHADWSAAFALQPFAFLLLPLALAWALAPAATGRWWRWLPARSRTAVLATLIVACLARWLASLA